MRTLSLLSLFACSASPVVEPGDYVVTALSNQDTGSASMSAPGVQFTVTATSGGLHVASLSVLFDDVASDIPGSGSQYQLETYQGFATNCEAGPNKMCSYSFSSTTVTAPSTRSIRIETCRRSTFVASCTSPTPYCGDAAVAKQALGSMVPCDVPQAIDGDLR